MAAAPADLWDGDGEGAPAELHAPGDQGQDRALLHAQPRQPYAHGKYPKPAVKAEASARTPQGRLGVLAAAAAAAVAFKVKQNRHHHRLKSKENLGYSRPLPSSRSPPCHRLFVKP